ncbi:DNA-directed RNA polymerase specialized sigma subunit [human gut metagenome]|uniref:DNA-directed RNA polymerase specialized sigma subunit n=1 Tax=human gut metagenome TaxID=408170 RepID=K1TJF1_9ZZZZ
MDQIGDNNDDRNRLDEIALKEEIIGLDDREKNILQAAFFQRKNPGRSRTGNRD